jgi:hypothetical protein
VKFQRSSERFLNRLSAETSHWSPNSISDLMTSVVPVFVLGEDAVDLERAVYVGEPFSPAIVGQVSHVLLEAGTRELQVLSVIASVSAATRIGLNTTENLWTTFEGALTRPSAALVIGGDPPLSLAQPTSGTRVTRGNAAWGAAAGLQVAASSPLELVRAPLILPAGNRLTVALQDANIGVSAQFTWRELS